MKSKIEGFEKVVQAVGFETVFHDGEILRIELNRVLEEPSLTICLLTRRSLRPTEKDPSDPLFYLVWLKFHSIDGLELRGFNHQNVLAELVEEEADGRLKLWFATLFGADLSFTCKRAEVVLVEATEMERGKPYHAKEQGAPD